MATEIEPEVIATLAGINDLQVGDDISADSVNVLVDLAKKNVLHVHDVVDANGAITSETSVVQASSAPANVVAGQEISQHTVSQILSMVNSLIDHTHTYTDTYASNCNCNCNCSRGIL